MFLRKMAFVLLFSIICIATVVSSTENEDADQAIKSGFLKKIKIFKVQDYCLFAKKYPLWLTSIPLAHKSIREKILNAGASPECIQLILGVEYMIPSKREIKLLKESKHPIIWVMGGPGTGKGTFCSRLMETESYTHISVGDLIRAQVKTPPYPAIGQLLQDIMNQGQLMPGSVSLSLLIRKMLSELKTTKGFLIDGYPRSLEQGIIFKESIRDPDSIILLQANDEILKHRVLNRNQGRKDDNEETIEKRLKIYHEQTKPVYKSELFSGKVKKVNVENTDVNVNYSHFYEAVQESLIKREEEYKHGKDHTHEEEHEHDEEHKEEEEEEKEN